MREKIKNILSNCYTKQGEFNEDKALNELCVLLDVSNSFNGEMKVEDCEYYCSDECDCVEKYCGYGK